MMKDLYLKPRPDGQDILLINGLPTLSGGLDNMIYILLSSSDWWGNTEAPENGILDSKIPTIMSEKPLTNQTRLNIEAEAIRVTNQMITAGIVERIEVRSEIPGKGILYLAIKVFRPEIEEGIDFIYALNWDTQNITIEGGTW
jgi:phage gp46-like protein